MSPALVHAFGAVKLACALATALRVAALHECRALAVELLALQEAGTTG